MKERHITHYLRFLPWEIMLFLGLLGAVSTGLLYSAAGGSWSPWALKHLARLTLGFTLFGAVMLTPARIWRRNASLLLAGTLILLLSTMVLGRIGMGARRWLAIPGLGQLQPSEFIKIAVILWSAFWLDRLYRGQETLGRFLLAFGSGLSLPIFLILAQPDLGTALIVLFLGLGILLLSGFALWPFTLAALASALASPFLWAKLKLYQKKRLLIFLNPESDPLGAGYHILQSKISLGSGGLWGKGFLAGTQAQLNFLPEKHTDFIFTLLGEEWGLVGTTSILGLYALLTSRVMIKSYRLTSCFDRFFGMGMGLYLFLHTAINTGMVMGGLPVVGVPLIFLSYGGSSLLSGYIGLGILASFLREEHLQIKQPSGQLAIALEERKKTFSLPLFRKLRD